MTETTENKTPSRSKLTLKLGSGSLKTVAQKQKDSKNLNSVQVTIRGRKAQASKIENIAGSGLNKNEFEARIKAIATSATSETKEFDVLEKIKNVKSSSKKIKLKEEAIEESVVEELINIEPESDKNNIKIEEEVVNLKPLEKNEEVEKVEIKEEKKQEESSSNISNFVSSVIEIDEFNVRDKIKQSLEISNRQKEERAKVLEERKKQEQEKLDKESKAKNKKFIDDFESNNKKKSFFKDSKINNRKLTTYIIDDESEDSRAFRRRKKSKEQFSEKSVKEYKKIINEVLLPDLITVSDLADRMAEKTGDVVKKLFTMGMVATSNQVIDSDTAELIVSEFGHIAKRVSHSDVENILTQNDNSDFEKSSRAPVVTIMGHVDHGKTSLLDAIRSTKVVDKESGGITQHIGASRIKTTSGKFITFLDTPGHEAFTEMRSRGANVTDIVVLVVAADDGVKEQTIEAISHAKAANVPIIVAVNKIDKPGCDPQRVKNELLSHNIISEDLGGEVMFVEVSAKQKINLDKLEESILLQAEILDLKAPYEGKCSGIVVESKIDQSKGVIASLLIQEGTMEVGDLIVVGTSYGRIRKMIDDGGKNIKSATPSVPVEVLGLNQAPNSGDKFFEVEEEKQAREIILYRERKEREDKSLKNSARSIGDIFKEAGTGKTKNLNILLKADVYGSVEAIAASILKLSNDEVAIKIIHQAAGGINESDINLASVSNALIVGFNVRENDSAKELAKSKNVDIRHYSIIYNIVDDLKLMLSGLLEPSKNEEYLGKAEIRQVFKTSASGKIAGAFVTDGLIKRNSKIRLIRDNIVIHEGTLKTLKRFKEDAKEVRSGFECGFSIENYEDIKEKDLIECFEIIEQKRFL